MRIAYATNVRLPSERAHGHQIAQVCDALVTLGHGVTLFAPFRRNVVTEDYWTYYGARREVALTHIGSVDPIALPLPGFLRLWLLNTMLRRGYRRALTRDRFDLLYTRAPALLPALVATGIPTVLELHQLPRRGKTRFVRLCQRCALVVCLTSPMRDELMRWEVAAELLTVEGDAVDLRRFAALPARNAARLSFGIHTTRYIVGYVGRLKTLGMEKGVADLLRAVAELRSVTPLFAFVVGGPASDRAEYESLAQTLGLTSEDVLFMGEVEAARIPPSLAACDILAMPFPNFPHYRTHMSPLKMFEYMASERPIVTSDLPTVRDVLSEETAVFCRPGDPESLADALRWIVEHPEEAATRARTAKELVETHHTWEERMGRILARVSGDS